ncbi:SET domain-containing protein SmydA-8-like [Amphibalanus amphitrite]|uniref:SET domain-containing protein SmydA-8-like n=1 Tax=Amphibalanus amphitrite TaxID=1232801 RepID=UPI001C925ED4|nr:SET domain-containing protein SmydA-8-like [Amphibalanus amphitrite]
MSARCARCGAPAEQRCAGCSVPFYCGRQCQRADWKQHRPLCQPLTVRQAAGVGRYTVAGRALAAGQLLLRELPLAAGPQLEAEPQCLGCGGLLAASAASCARCRWPVCGDRCADSAAHAAECQVLARDTGDRPAAGTEPCARYDCILPLRVLLLRDQPRLWQKVEQLESHLEQRRDTAIFRDNQRHVVDYLRGRCGVQADEQLLHRICGVLDVNAFSVRPRPGAGRRRGLFARASLLNHACVSNTQLSLDGDTMLVRAAVPIAAGDEVTASYVSAMEPTARRQNFLWHGKYFRCQCRRCVDPTELGTHYGSHRCSECGGMMESQQPTDADAPWRCSGCCRAEPADQVRQLNARLLAERQAIPETAVPALEAFLARHAASPLHDANYHVLAVKQALAQAYGNVSGFQLDELSEGRLVAKEAFCRQLIGLAQTFEPGLCRLRGLLLLQLHHAQVTRAQRRHAAGAPPRQLLAALEAAGQHVEEAVSVLGHEPASTPEGGAMLQLARDTLQGCYELAELVRASLAR